MHHSDPHPTRIQTCGAKAAMGLFALLSLTGGVWATGAIAPPVAQAYTGRLAISLEAQPDESFEALIRRAEAVARAAAQRNFDRDILVTDVQIIVSAEKLSRVSPILTLEATRYQWSRQPDARRWATYYKNAKRLLGFADSSPTTTSAPAARPPAPAPTQTSPNTTTNPNPTNTPNAAPAAPPQPLSPFPSSTQQPLSPFPTTSPSDGTGGNVQPTTTPAPTNQPAGSPQIIPDRIPSPVR